MALFISAFLSIVKFFVILSSCEYPWLYLLAAYLIESHNGGLFSHPTKYKAESFKMRSNLVEFAQCWFIWLVYSKTFSVRYYCKWFILCCSALLLKRLKKNMFSYHLCSKFYAEMRWWDLNVESIFYKNWRNIAKICCLWHLISLPVISFRGNYFR